MRRHRLLLLRVIVSVAPEYLGSSPPVLCRCVSAVVLLFPVWSSIVVGGAMLLLRFPSSLPAGASAIRVYGKLRYVTRVDYLWENVRRNEVEIPEFVFDHDEDLEYRSMMDYGLESDHARVYGVPPTMDSPVSTYSMRCIS
ncbi:hypothetical protein HN873_056898 [Arachis hypogaea]